jgi:hypothetical protein
MPPDFSRYIHCVAFARETARTAAMSHFRKVNIGKNPLDETLYLSYIEKGQ